MPEALDFALIEAETPVCQVFRVAVENVTPLWPQVAPLVTRGLAGHVTHDAEDVRRMLLGQTLQLWVQWSDRVEAVAVSEFAVYPKGVWVRIFLAAAASDSHLDGEAFLASLSQWRDMHGCQGFEAIGRMGWLRRFPDMRFVGAVMRSER